MMAETRVRLAKGVPALDALDANATAQGLGDSCGRGLPEFEKVLGESTEIADPVLSEMWTAQAADATEWRRTCLEGSPDDQLQKRILVRQQLIQRRKDEL
jgi:hypothetical protein